MSYFFNNPKTEEELKEQFRKLLVKYDYHNPSNVKLISDMRNEYEKELLRIKRANGYRTPFEKFTSFVKNEINDVKELQRIEQERIARLRNHKYTKDEYIKAYQTTQMYLGKVIEDLAKTGLYAPLIIGKANLLDDKTFFQWFNAQRISMITDPKLEENYNRAREVLEYAIQYISKLNRVSFEKNMVLIEAKLGEFFKNYYRECCDKYRDPIEIAEYENTSHTNIVADEKWLKFSTFVMSMVIMMLPSSLISFTFYTVLPNRVSTILMLFISMLLAVPLAKVLYRLFSKLNKSSTYTTIVGKERARVTQKENFEKNRCIYSLLRFLLR